MITEIPKEVLMAVGALFVLGLVLLMVICSGGYGKSSYSHLRLDNIARGLVPDSLAYAAFVVVFMIVALPFYPFYVLGAAVWHKYHPPVVPVPLPVEGDDPIWGRNVNRKRVEEIFRAVQQAWMQRETESLKEFVSADVRADLRQVCHLLKAHYEVNTRQDIHITEINIHDEKINDDKWGDHSHSISYHFAATIRGTMTNFTTREQDGQLTAGSSDPQAFEEKMQFSRSTGSTDPWCLVKSSGVPERVTHDSLKRKRLAAEAEAAAHSDP